MMKMKTKPMETLCIGDEIRDIEAAQKAATAFGGVAWGYTRPDALKANPAVTMFYTTNEIIETVLRN